MWRSGVGNWHIKHTSFIIQVDGTYPSRRQDDIISMPAFGHFTRVHNSYNSKIRGIRVLCRKIVSSYIKISEVLITRGLRCRLNCSEGNTSCLEIGDPDAQILITHRTRSSVSRSWRRGGSWSSLLCDGSVPSEDNSNRERIIDTV